MIFAGQKDWAPLPLRGVLGIGLIMHGGIKLFGEGGHENIVHLITQLGVPFPGLMGWVVGLVEFGGGLGIRKTQCCAMSPSTVFFVK